MDTLKILVFEYITGGGLNKEGLPDALAKEGLMMLQALAAALAQLPGVEFTVMLDARIEDDFSPPASANIRLITPEQDSLGEFKRLLQDCDAVWPIAPESGGILHRLCSLVVESDKILLNSAADTVAITGNKWLTYQKLSESGIATVPTDRLENFNYLAGEWVIKANDGVGCTDCFVVSQNEDFDAVTAGLELTGFIIQPHLLGLKTSLSCLFKQGQGWLLSVNLQQFTISERRYKLTGIIVNISTGINQYLALVAAIAKALPGLWGYVGIDLIETAEQHYVLEINPRLTSSFAGIYPAIGINPAQAVLDLLQGEPLLIPSCDRPVNLAFQ